MKWKRNGDTLESDDRRYRIVKVKTRRGAGYWMVFSKGYSVGYGTHLKDAKAAAEKAASELQEPFSDPTGDFDERKP